MEAMNRDRTFRYLFSEEGDVYLHTRVLLVELPFDVDQYELGPCVDPQIDIDNPEHVISKTPVSVLGLLEENKRMEEALRKIMDARDYHADNAKYPLPPNGPDHATQCFDDWAADLASEALSPLKALELEIEDYNRVTDAMDALSENMNPVGDMT